MLTTIIECVDLEAEVAFFRDEAGCRIHLVSPADDPQLFVMHAPDGGAIELVRAATDRPASLAITWQERAAEEVVSPGGSCVRIRPEPAVTRERFGASMDVPTNLPDLTIVHSVDGSFSVGRAGMEYRDLLPGRWGGRFIASHIRLLDGGEVDDWVHFHQIRFQMIYVAAGWVDVVYEDQGDSFRMVAGDCVLQPPEIRHRVLRSSPGFEVIEVGCPADHDTIADHRMDLPTTLRHDDRVFSGQRFVRHVARDAAPTAWLAPELSVRDTGIGAATEGLAGAVVVSGSGDTAASGRVLTHQGEFVLVVGLSGEATLDVDGAQVTLTPRTSIALPAGSRWTWGERTGDHTALVVTLPADTIELA